MNDTSMITNPPALIQTLLMLEASHRADALQQQRSRVGETIPRRQAIVEAVTDLAQDMALFLDVWEKARVE